MWPSPSGKNGLQKQKEFKMAGKRNWIRTGLGATNWFVITGFALALAMVIFSYSPQSRTSFSPDEKSGLVEVDGRRAASDGALLMTGASSEQPQRWKVLETPPEQSPFKRTILIYLQPLGGDGSSDTKFKSRGFTISALHTFFTEFQKLKKGHVITLRFVGISDPSRWEEEMS